LRSNHDDPRYQWTLYICYSEKMESDLINFWKPWYHPINRVYQHHKSMNSILRQE
jgi:hypothetical protein